MPRFYDPTQGDITVKILNWITNVFTENTYSLNNEQIEIYLKRFKNEGLFKNYGNRDFLITNKCGQGNILFDDSNVLNKYYPSHFDGERIVICQNWITNSVQLLENVTREFELSIKNDKENDTQQQIRACKKSYQIYKLDENKQRQLTEQCSRMMLRHRNKNEEQLPYDQWLKFVEKQLKDHSHYM